MISRVSIGGVLLIIIVLGLASSGVSSSRASMKVTELETRLPRGPVPPAGGSPCHNKFSSRNVLLSSSSVVDEDYINCP